jgi:hypothetical protein
MEAEFLHFQATGNIVGASNQAGNIVGALYHKL